MITIRKELEMLSLITCSYAFVDLSIKVAPTISEINDVFYLRIPRTATVYSSLFAFLLADKNIFTFSYII